MSNEMTFGLNYSQLLIKISYSKNRIKCVISTELLEYLNRILTNFKNTLLNFTYSEKVTKFEELSLFVLRLLRKLKTKFNFVWPLKNRQLYWAFTYNEKSLKKTYILFPQTTECVIFFYLTINKVVLKCGYSSVKDVVIPIFQTFPQISYRTEFSDYVYSCKVEKSMFSVRHRRLS